MKSHLSRVVALSFLASASLPTWAQPNIAPPEPRRMPTFNLSDSNTSAIALIGAFYNKMRLAQSGRVHVTGTKTLVDNGKVISKKVFDMQSSWIGDAKRAGMLTKEISSYSLSLTSDEGAIIEESTILKDNTNTYAFRKTKNIWSESVHGLNEVAMPLPLVQITWLTALTFFGLGNEFEIERKIVDGQDQFFLNLPNVKYVFDVNSGNLKSLTVTNKGETTEIRWLETDFNEPLQDSLFKWKAPEGATQVAPEATKSKLQF